jgi:hypothetical protein
MSASAPLQLPPPDKLDALRYLDEFHFWHSLDEERVCRRCGRTITGWQILVFEREGTRGAMRLQCPTPGCVSRPGDWIYANPVQAARLHGKADATRNDARDKLLADDRVHHGERKKRRLAELLSPDRVRSVIARLALPRSFAARLHMVRPIH